MLLLYISKKMPDKKELWKNILVGLKENEITRPNLITWFRGSCVKSCEDGVLEVALPRDIFVSWHEKNSRNKIQRIAQGYNPEIARVDFVVDGTLDNESDPRTIDLLGLFPKEDKKPRKMPKISEVKLQGGILSRMLNPNFSLANFVIGPENRLAHACSEAVAHSPGAKYNPLFIYGDVGLGKTHLLHAIGNEIIRTKPALQVAFVSAENFFAEFIDMVRNQKGERFREKWRKADVFIIDDIQFIAGKERTEEVFFHLFNDLFDANKQIIISSDKPPSELNGMSARLVSRFSMGMLADLYFPSLETRVAILQQKAQEIGIVLDVEMLTFIAENVHHSIRELEGVLTQIVARIDIEGVLPNKTILSQIIKRVNKDMVINTNQEEQMTDYAKNIGDVIDKISEFYNISRSAILGANRSREFVVPRQVAMWFCKKYLKLPLQKIGNYFGGRDHTSVMSAIRKVEQNRKLDVGYSRNLTHLRKEMGF
jgi:chromosomal replication initiator protein